MAGRTALVQGDRTATGAAGMARDIRIGVADDSGIDAEPCHRQAMRWRIRPLHQQQGHQGARQQRLDRAHLSIIARRRADAKPEEPISTRT
jgi:hypothetical protein